MANFRRYQGQGIDIVINLEQISYIDYIGRYIRMSDGSQFNMPPETLKIITDHIMEMN